MKEQENILQNLPDGAIIYSLDGNEESEPKIKSLNKTFFQMFANILPQIDNDKY